MKQVKTLSLAAVTAMALMAFAATSASATALYNGTTKLGAGTNLDFSVTQTIKVTSTSGEVLTECTGSTLKGSTGNAGGAGISVVVNISEFTWSGCTLPVAVDVKGSFEIAQIGTSTEGTVKAKSPISLTTNTVFFGTCAWTFTEGAHIGVIKTTATGTAAFNWTGVLERGAGGPIGCPESVKFVAGTYASTSPDNLRVEAS